MSEFPGYQILERIGSGSQADVFLGRRAADGAAVALKIVRFAEVADGDERNAPARLRREARLLQTVESPYVVKVLDLLETPDAVCLVMEYLPGQTLELERRARLGASAARPDAEAATKPIAAAGPKPLAPPVLTRAAVPAAALDPGHVAWALARGIQLARGVADLHARGCVHRDLKPANAMIVGDRIVIFDFGVARADGSSKLTRTRAPIGTPLYWSPEQAIGLLATPRSDVFTLGAMIFELLVGTSPLRANTHLPPPRWRIPRVDRLHPGVSKSVATVLARALELDPRDRHPDAGAMVDQLERAAAGAEVRIPFSPARSFRHHRRKVLGVGGAAALAAACAALWPAAVPAHPAARIAEAVRTGDIATARSIWDSFDDSGEREARDRLNELLRDDGTTALPLADATGHALLHLAADPNWTFASTPSDPGGSEAMPAADRFAPLGKSTLQLVPLGYASLWIRPARGGARQTFRFLRHHEDKAASEPAASRPWESVSTSAAAYGADAWCEGPGSPVQVWRGPVRERVDLPRRFAIGRHEISRRQWDRFLDALRLPEELRLKIGPARLAWLAHPDEPEQASADFQDLLRVPGASPAAADPDGDLPVLVSFWGAWRFATYHGCVLPTPIEWHAVAQRDVEPPGTSFVMTPAAALVPVRPPTFAAGGAPVHLPDNAREWCAELRLGPKRPAGAMAYPLDGTKDGHTFYFDLPFSLGQQGAWLLCAKTAGFRTIRLEED